MNRRKFLAFLCGLPFAPKLLKSAIQQKERCNFRMSADWVPFHQALYCNDDKGHSGNHSYRTPWQTIPEHPKCAVQFVKDAPNHYYVYYVTKNGVFVAPEGRCISSAISPTA